MRGWVFGSGLVLRGDEVSLEVMGTAGLTDSGDREDTDTGGRDDADDNATLGESCALSVDFCAGNDNDISTFCVGDETGGGDIIVGDET